MPSSAGSEEHTSELQSPCNLVCRLLLEKKSSRVDRPWDQHTHAADSCGPARARGCVVSPADVPASVPVGLRRRDLFFFFLNRAAPPQLPLLPRQPASPH